MKTLKIFFLCAALLCAVLAGLNAQTERDILLAVTTHTVPDHANPGANITPSCTLANIGQNPLTAVASLNVYLDEELVASHPDYYSVALNPNATSTATFPIFTPTVANVAYRFEFRVDPLEDVIDGDPSNNILNAYLNTTLLVDRQMVVMEIATGTWCQYCPGAAMGADDLVQGGYNVAVIENHNGDPYANTTSNARNSYYSPSGYPTAYFDGVLNVSGGSNTTSMFSYYLPKVNQRNAVKTPLSLQIFGEEDRENYDVTIRIEKLAPLTNQNLVAHLALTQSNISYAWQGQTHLEFVDRQMYPTHTGTPVDLFNAPIGYTDVNLSIARNTAWGGVPADYELVAFIQDLTTKEIIQGQKVNLTELLPPPLSPPQNLAATSTHASVTLTWDAPGGVTPNNYKVYKNSSYLTTTASLTYNDLAVTDGVTYSYYVVASYDDGDSEPSNTVNATPNTYPPTNLTAVGSDTVVFLNWSAAEGRGDESEKLSEEKNISGYRIYRDGSSLTTLTGTSYADHNVVNGTTYSYWVTTLYSNPSGESAASNTAEATPLAMSYAVIGSGTGTTPANEGCPINIYKKSLHGQSVYTAAELNAAGLYGPTDITQLGFYVATAPALTLPNFRMRMKHTAATDVTDWISADGLTTVYSSTSYLPVAGDWDMLILSAPFAWNGIDNIVIDTNFDRVGTESATGTVRYSETTSGYRYGRSSFSNMGETFTGGVLSTYRPNVKLGFPYVELAAPQVTIASNGESGVMLSWELVPNASNYEVLRSFEPDGEFGHLAFTEDLSYEDSEILDRAFYKVKALSE